MDSIPSPVKEGVARYCVLFWHISNAYHDTTTNYIYREDFVFPDIFFLGEFAVTLRTVYYNDSLESLLYTISLFC